MVWRQFCATVGPSQPYYWVDGSDVGYTNWDEGEPNYDPEDALHCGHLIQNGLWGAYVCHDTGIGSALNFVCKTPQGIFFKLSVTIV
jgi:hypothetical protein